MVARGGRKGGGARGMGEGEAMRGARVHSMLRAQAMVAMGPGGRSAEVGQGSRGDGSKGGHMARTGSKVQGGEKRKRA